MRVSTSHSTPLKILNETERPEPERKSVSSPNHKNSKVDTCKPFQERETSPEKLGAPNLFEEELNLRHRPLPLPPHRPCWHHLGRRTAVPRSKAPSEDACVGTPHESWAPGPLGDDSFTVTLPGILCRPHTQFP